MVLHKDKISQLRNLSQGPRPHESPSGRSNDQPLKLKVANDIDLTIALLTIYASLVGKVSPPLGASLVADSDFYTSLIGHLSRVLKFSSFDIYDIIILHGLYH